jgi:hypothetical protein
MKKVVLVVAIALLGCLTSCKKEEVNTNQNTPTIPNYTNFKITSIKVNKIPFVDNQSASWDYFDGPDLFFNIENTNSAIIFDGSSAILHDLSTSSLPVNWSFANAYQITNFDYNYFITLYDYDSADPNDNIGYVGFNFNQHKSGYPSSITKVSSDGSISITINGSWY